MSYDELLVQFNSWVATITAVGGWAFVFLYGFGSSWRRHILGRMIMLLIFCLTALLTIISFVRWHGDFPFRREVNTVLFTSLGVSVYGLLTMLFRYQLLDRLQKREEPPDERDRRRADGGPGEPGTGPTRRP